MLNNIFLSVLDHWIVLLSFSVNVVAFTVHLVCIIAKLYNIEQNYTVLLTLLYLFQLRHFQIHWLLLEQN